MTTFNPLFDLVLVAEESPAMRPSEEALVAHRVPEDGRIQISLRGDRLSVWIMPTDLSVDYLLDLAVRGTSLQRLDADHVAFSGFRVEGFNQTRGTAVKVILARSGGRWDPDMSPTEDAPA